MRRRSLFFLLILASLVSGCSKALGNRTIEIRARVVDKETGQPINNVEASITERSASVTGQDFLERNTSQQWVNGIFEYTCNACLSVTVLLRADGYYAEKRVYTKAADNTPGDDPTADIPMEGHAEYVTLLDYHGRLIASEDPLETVVLPMLDRPRNDTRLERLKNNAASAGQSIPAYLTLVVSTNEDGSIATQPHPRVRSYEIPETAFIDFTMAEGGVIPFTPTERHIHLIRREMRLAPESGYQPRLELMGDEKQWFYARIGGRYGMGSATAPTVIRHQDGSRSVEISVSLQLNPDGTRNLNSRRANP